MKDYSPAFLIFKTLRHSKKRMVDMEKTKLKTHALTKYSVTVSTVP